MQLPRWTAYLALALIASLIVTAVPGRPTRAPIPR